MKNRALIVVGWLALAIAIAGAFYLALGPYRLQGDEEEYKLVAGRLAAGAGLTNPGGSLYCHEHPPLYAAFMGAVYALAGAPRDDVVRGFQLALAFGTVLLAAAAARRYYGERVAAATLAAAVLYLPTYFYALQLLSEILFAFLLAAGVWLLLRGADAKSARTYALCAAGGFAFGLAGLTRGVGLACALGAAAWLFLQSGAGAGRRFLRVVAFAAALAAAVVPWSAYAYSRVGHLLITNTEAGEVAWKGNNPATPLHHPWHVTTRSVPPPGSGGGEDVFALSRICAAGALAFAREHPALTAARAALRALDLWEPERLFLGGYRWGDYPHGRAPFIQGLIGLEVAVSAAALLLFWVGLVLMPGGRWRSLLLVLVAATTAAYALTVAHPRYNYPLLVVGAPAIAYALAEGWRGVRERRYSRARVAAAAVAVAALLAVWARAAWLFLARGI